MDYSCIVFDTAPTGHTLRLLQFPATLQKGLNKLMSLRGMLGGMLTQVTQLLGGPSGGMQNQLFEKLEEMQAGTWLLLCSTRLLTALQHACQQWKSGPCRRPILDFMNHDLVYMNVRVTIWGPDHRQWLGAHCPGMDGCPDAPHTCQVRHSLAN